MNVLSFGGKKTGVYGWLPLFLILGMPFLQALGEVPARLVSLRNIYAEHMRKIQEEYQTLHDTWPEAYLRDVQRIGMAFQQAGNLDGLRAAREEENRFRTDRTISEKNPASVLPELVALRKQHRMRKNQIRIARARKIDELTSRYAAGLKTLQAERTRAGNIDEALQYNGEIKRVQALPEVTSARFELAATEGEEANLADRQDEAKAEAEKAAKAEDDKIQDPIQSPDGVSIVEGTTPPRDTDLAFRTLSLNLSSRTRLARNISVRARLAQEADSASARTTSSFYRATSRSGQRQYHVQLDLRSASTTEFFSGARLLVDFYGRDADRGARRLAPQLITSELVDLPDLNTERWVFVTFPPVSVQTDFSRTSTYSGTSTSRRGQEFHGVVVSVFDKNEELIYQSTCSRDLDSLAPAEFPKDHLHKRAVQMARQKMQQAQAAMDNARGAQTEPGARSEAYQQAWREYSEAQREYYRLLQTSP